VNGQITGFSLDIGVIDDPMKGRAEATSLANRDKTWSWLTDDFFSRFSNYAGMLMIGTRWHVDDPIGGWQARFGDSTKMLRYPAIAEVDELYRKKGIPLFPEHKSLEFLMERRKLYTDAAWEALYQQAPYVVGGGAIPIEKLKVLAQKAPGRHHLEDERGPAAALFGPSFSDREPASRSWLSASCLAVC